MLMRGRVPLFPLFLKGNSTPTWTHHTTQVVTPEGQRVPVRNRRRSRRGWPQGEQRVGGQPVAVAREASHWGPVRV